MEEKNVFQQLQEEQEVNYDSIKDNVKHNINSRRGVWSFLGDVIDLYIPNVFSALVGQNSVSSSISSIDSKDKII